MGKGQALRGQPNTDSKSDLPIETVRRLCCDGSVVAVTESKESSAVKVRVPAEAQARANASRDAFEVSPATPADDAPAGSTVDSQNRTLTDSAYDPSRDALVVSPAASADDAPAGSTVDSQDRTLTDMADNPSRDASELAAAVSSNGSTGVMPAVTPVDSHNGALTDSACNPSRDASAGNAPAGSTVDSHDNTLTNLAGNPSRDAFELPPATAPNAAAGRSRPSLNLSRKHRLVQPALRRALEARDRGCRFPWCSHERWLDAHHVVHWADGGETSLGNTLLLCSRHHRLLHEGGFAIRADANGEWQFQNAKGMRQIPAGG